MMILPPPTPLAVGEQYGTPEEQTEAMAAALHTEWAACCMLASAGQIRPGEW